MKKKVECIEKAIQEVLQEKKHVIIAIDGRCAAGKSTLAMLLSKKEEVTLVHMDDFFLQEEQIIQGRRSIPGENVDHERFLEEVLLPMSLGKPFIYKPFDCKTRKFKESKVYKPTSICIVEGSYSCHKELWKYYDLHVFMDVDKKVQLERLKQRNASNLEAFLNLWIPLEEMYFKVYKIKENCEIVI